MTNSGYSRNQKERTERHRQTPHYLPPQISSLAAGESISTSFVIVRKKVIATAHKGVVASDERRWKQITRNIDQVQDQIWAK
jgi:hypothetical protein